MAYGEILVAQDRQPCRVPDGDPHLIYLPERTIVLEKFYGRRKGRL